MLLLRDASPGGDLEVLMTRRSGKASFAPGGVRLPRRGVDEADRLAHPVADRRPTQSDERLTQAIAAIRESFEELGILLARHASGPRQGQMANAQDIAALDRHQPFAEQCSARGLRLAADSVFLLAHWTADRDLPRRFAVPFLVARMPEGQEPVADEAEQFEPVWVRPADALARHEAGQFFMIFPTIRTLQRLARFANTNAVLAAAGPRATSVDQLPRAGLLGGKEARHMEGDAPFGELALVCPDGQIAHPLDWQSERPVPLLKRAAPHHAQFGRDDRPRHQQLPGGRAGHRLHRHRPRPADPDHLEKLWRAAGGDIRMIVCTHSHPDHFPGAAPLQAMCERAGRAEPPIFGPAIGPRRAVVSQFTPDRALQNNQLLALTGKALEGEITHTLQVVHAPATQPTTCA